MSNRSLEEIIDEYDIEGVLAIGTGTLPMEVDLEALAEGLGEEYDPEDSNPGVDCRTGDGEDDTLPMNTFYQQDYIIRTDTEEELYEEQERVLDELTELGVLTEDQRDEVEFEVSNIACVAEIGTHFDLSPLAVGLGFENAEYEPEQFPAVIYHSDEYACTFSIFSSGKIVAPGAKSTEEAIRALDAFINDELIIFKSEPGTAESSSAPDINGDPTI